MASVGLDLGARLQSPTRLAPFVGVGGSAGILLQDAVPLLLDLGDDSPPSLLDEEEAETTGGLATFYPEVGAHFWLDGRIRLTAFGRYLITTEGRDFDDWLVGGQISIFAR